MDIFKFINPVHPTKLDQGQLINGLKSKLWIERYRDVSNEFELANVTISLDPQLRLQTVDELTLVQLCGVHRIDELEYIHATPPQ